MKTLLVLLGLSLHTAAFAQEYLGAAKAVERIATESAQAKAGDEKKNDPVTQWRARVGEFMKATPTLAPKDAAAQWLALVDAGRALPADGNRRSFDGESNTPSATFALTALPPPAAWDALDEAVAARPLEADSATLNLTLRMLTSALRGDHAMLAKTVADLKKAAVKSRGDRFSEYEFRGLDEWIAALKDDPKTVVARFEEEFAKFEQGESSGTLEIPDLVTLLGTARAETSIQRALMLPGAMIDVETGDSTRALAVKLTTKLAARLKKPQWRLIHGISTADLTLYEALAKKFPRKDGEDDDGRDDAESYYLIGLIEAKRSGEAVKLAIARAERAGEDADIGDGIGTAIRAGSVQGVRVFLRELLAKNPALPFWDDFISVSARIGEPANALAFLRETAARADLPAQARDYVGGHLWTALLAADEIDEGVKLLRELLEERIAELITDPMAAKKRSRRSSNDDPGSLAIRLCRIGRLLEKPDLIEAGLKAARMVIAESASAGETSGIDTTTADLLFDLERGAEAEALLVDAVIVRKKNSKDRENESPIHLRALANLYHRASRTDDVLALLTESPDWNAPDLAGIANDSFDGTLLAHITATALAAVGRKDEARNVVLHLLERKPGFDPAYELLLQLKGDDLIAQLDRLFARDRFEERPLIWKAKLQLEAGQLDEAEKTVRAAIAIDPSDGEQGKGTRMRAYAVLGDILEKKGDAAQAKIMRGAVEAIRLSENGDDWWQAGLLTRAVKKYEEALGHFADAYCIQSRLALRYADLGNFAKAEEHYRRAFELMPESFGRVESHCFGCEHAFNGERAQGIAEKVFTQLAEKTPGKAQVFYLLGYLRQEQDRYVEAAESFRKAVTRDPDYLNAWKKLAGLEDSITIPHAEREATALNILRLDPLRRHETRDSVMSAVADFRVLWKVLEDAAKLMPAQVTELFPLPASKAEDERRQKAAAESGQRTGSSRMAREAAAPRTPGAMLLQHGFIQKIAQLLR